jgi:hypothetical protein
MWVYPGGTGRKRAETSLTRAKSARVTRLGPPHPGM